MDGIVEELLRLENAKHQALIELDAERYEAAVRQQTSLIDDPGISDAARNRTDDLLAFSKLANFNSSLYENLLATAPWIAAASRSYTGHGHIDDPAASHGFSVEA